jgi:hypothetical protein
VVILTQINPCLLGTVSLALRHSYSLRFIALSSTFSVHRRMFDSGLERCERKQSWPIPINRSDCWKQRQAGLSICGQRCDPGTSGIRSGIVTNRTAMSDVSTVKTIINLWKEKRESDLEVRILYPPWIAHSSGKANRTIQGMCHLCLNRL